MSFSNWRTPQQAYADQQRRLEPELEPGFAVDFAIPPSLPDLLGDKDDSASCALTGRKGRFSLILPWPPTVNHSGADGMRFGRKTPEYKDFMQHTAMVVINRRIKPLNGRLAVTIIASPPDPRARDLDNIIKPILDALQRAGCFPNDFAVDHLQITRVHGNTPGIVSVSVKEI